VFQNFIYVDVLPYHKPTEIPLRPQGVLLSPLSDPQERGSDEISYQPQKVEQMGDIPPLWAHGHQGNY